MLDKLAYGLCHLHLKEYRIIAFNSPFTKFCRKPPVKGHRLKRHIDHVIYRKLKELRKNMMNQKMRNRNKNEKNEEEEEEEEEESKIHHFIEKNLMISVIPSDNDDQRIDLVIRDVEHYTEIFQILRHNVKNSLNAINGFLTLLKITPLTMDARSYVKSAHQEIDEIINLLNRDLNVGILDSDQIAFSEIIL